jgi:hypothetical protein
MHSKHSINNHKYMTIHLEHTHRYSYAWKSSFLLNHNSFYNVYKTRLQQILSSSLLSIILLSFESSLFSCIILLALFSYDVNTLGFFTKEGLLEPYSLTYIKLHLIYNYSELDLDSSTCHPLKESYMQTVQI